jgi:hypothetical protein
MSIGSNKNSKVIKDDNTKGKESLDTFLVKLLDIAAKSSKEYEKNKEGTNGKFTGNTFKTKGNLNINIKCKKKKKKSKKD